jgi:guanine nucleotide exchange factor
MSRQEMSAYNVTLENILQHDTIFNLRDHLRVEKGIAKTEMNSLLPCSTGQRLTDVIDLEGASYPADEAASQETLRYRAEVAPELFRVQLADQSERVAGFVCATAAPQGTTHLTHGSMSNHDVQGTVVCIHSVVVRPELRRRGLGLALVKTYVRELKESGRYEKALLLSKQRLIPFYQQAGFSLDGPSRVQHGVDVWYELRLDFT